MEDSLGICADLDAAMEAHVASYRDEWAATLADPDKLSQFVSFVNAPEAGDPDLAYVQRARPAPTGDRGRARRRADRRDRRWRCGHERLGRASAPRAADPRARRRRARPRPAGRAVPGHRPRTVADFVYAVGHRDPFADANVIARGIVGSVGRGRRAARHRRLADVQARLRPRHRRVPDRPGRPAARSTAPGSPGASSTSTPSLSSRRWSPEARGLMTELAPVLAGTRILVTAQRRSDELAAALSRRGAEVTVAPALGVVPHIDEESCCAVPGRSWTTPSTPSWSPPASASAAGWTPPRRPVWPTTWSPCSTASGWSRAGPKARGALQAAGLKADWVAESETSAEIVGVPARRGRGRPADRGAAPRRR